MRTFLALFVIAITAPVFLHGCNSGNDASNESIDESTDPRAELQKQPWYVIQSSSRKTVDGEAMVKCVESPYSPAEFMNELDSRGISYTVGADNLENDEISSVVNVSATLTDEQGLFTFARGLEFCEFVASSNAHVDRRQGLN